VATPFGQVEIASGVTIVGDVAYSPDGKWLAFSAQPKDGSTGPDLYVYGPGSTTAVAITSDHQSYFSAWLGSQVVASHVVVTTRDAGAPGSSKGPSAPAASGKGNEGQGGGKAIDGRPSSFLFDPATGTRTDLEQADVWMPVADPTGRFVAYWSGSLRSADGVTWHLADGALVLDRWVGDASSIGPAGQPTPIVTSHVEDFVAKFDPDGIRLGVWVSEHAGATDGRLHLFVIEPSTGTIADEQPLPGRAGTASLLDRREPPRLGKPVRPGWSRELAPGAGLARRRLRPDPFRTGAEPPDRPLIRLARSGPGRPALHSSSTFEPGPRAGDGPREAGRQRGERPSDHDPG
jgi:hypothetical protein